MQKVNVFIAIDNISPKPTEKKYGYILECDVKGEAVTREGYGQTYGSYHKAVLMAIADALERFNKKCNITIHTEDDFVLNMMQKNLHRWAENGFLTTKGKSVANNEEWSRVWSLAEKQNIQTKPGAHAYSNWLHGKLRKEI